MSFKPLTDCINAAIEDINNSASLLATKDLSDEFFKSWNAFVQNNIKLVASLKKTKEIINRRKRYWQLLESSKLNSNTEGVLLYLKAYHVSSWSAYDRLYDVYSRLSGTGRVAANTVPKGNVKVDEFFKDKKERFSFGSIEGRGELLKENFRWSYLASYKIRNIIVHDGGYSNNRDLFIYEDGLKAVKLTTSIDDLLKHEPEDVGVGDSRENSHLVRSADPRLTSDDAQVILNMLDYDIDCVLGFLIELAGNDFYNQVKYVCGMV